MTIPVEEVRIELPRSNETSQATKICKRIAYVSVCISTCAVIVLLIAGLIVGSINGKNDTLSQNLLISFAAIFGAMMLGGICCIIYVLIDRIIYKDKPQNLNNGEICFISGRQAVGLRAHLGQNA